MNSGLYKIVNSVNEHYYIGSTKNLKYRWLKGHRYTLRNNTHCNIRLQRAWNKYGESAFSCLPILFCSERDLEYYEDKLLGIVVGLKECYNIGKHSACPNRGISPTKETREKISIAIRNKPFSNAHRMNIMYSQLGQKKSDLHKNNLRKSWKFHKKGKFNDEDVARIRWLYGTGNYTMSYLANMFNTTRPYVSQLVNFRKRPTTGV